MRFSYAMDTFPCHLFQKSAEPRNSEENSCIVIIFEMPKHFKVNSENARRFIHSDLWHFLKNVGENVLIIGDGPSGQDLIIHLSSVAKSITLSRKNWLNATKEAQEKYHKKFPPTLFVKDIVKRLTAGGVEFIDGTRDIFSAVIFATGRMHLNIFIMAKFKSFLYGIFQVINFRIHFWVLNLKFMWMIVLFNRSINTWLISNTQQWHWLEYPGVHSISLCLIYR